MGYEQKLMDFSILREKYLVLTKEHASMKKKLACVQKKVDDQLKTKLQTQLKREEINL